MKEILELMQTNGVKKIDLIHLVDITPAMGESDEDVMVVNTIEQDKHGTLVCYDNRDEDEQGKYQPLWNVAQLPKQVQNELLFSAKYTLQQKSEPAEGRKVASQYNGKRYERKVATAKQAEVRAEKDCDLKNKIRDEYNRISENEDYVHIDDMTAFAKDVLVYILNDDRQDDNVCYDFEEEFHNALRELIVSMGVKYSERLKK